MFVQVNIRSVCACICPSVSVQSGRGHNTFICSSEWLKCVYASFCPSMSVESGRGW